MYLNILFILSLLFFSPAFASKAEMGINSKEAELKQLNQQIQQLQKTIQDSQGKRSQVSKQMQANADKLKELQKKVAEINRNIQQKKVALTHIQNQHKQYQDKFTLQQARLSQEMQASYHLLRTYNENLIGNNLDDLNKDVRLRTYIDALAQMDTQHYEQLKSTLRQLETQHYQVLQKETALKNALTEQQKSQQKLAVTQQTQQQALQQLNTQLQTKSAALNKLISDRKALETLLKNLAKEAALRKQQQKAQSKIQSKTQTNISSSVELPAGAAFTQVQGKLPWPVSGLIQNHFGESIEQSELKSTGVLIKAAIGQPIQTIYPGRIVFANHLQGLGQLIIVDHGKGYLSLYGHNQHLNKQIGDMVKAGEMIATVGNNDGQGTAGLYFEIRHNSQPLNPEQWCSKK